MAESINFTVLDNAKLRIYYNNQSSDDIAEFMIKILALISKVRKYVTKATFKTIDNGECNKFFRILFEIVKEIRARMTLNEINPNFTVNYDITAFNNYKNTLKIIIKYYFLMCKN